MTTLCYGFYIVNLSTGGRNVFLEAGGGNSFYQLFISLRPDLASQMLEKWFFVLLKGLVTDSSSMHELTVNCLLSRSSRLCCGKA